MIIILLLVLMLPLTGQDYVWPIKGTECGDGIISRPQQYVGNDLNFDQLFISAPMGAEVISPVNGTIAAIEIYRRNSFFSGKYFSYENKSINARIQEIAETDSDIDISDLNGFIVIRTDSGERVSIGGIRSDINWQTGDHIGQGKTIGTVYFDYQYFNIPHINLFIRNSSDLPVDPMAPFGLESTFISPEDSWPPEILTPGQATEDLTILFDAYKECYPSLNDRMEDKEFNRYRDSVLAGMTGDVSLIDFWYMVRNTTSREFLNDSHSGIVSPLPVRNSESVFPHLYFGYIGDSLFVTRAPKNLSRFIGKGIASVNGIAGMEIIRHADMSMKGFDQKAYGATCEACLTGWNLLFGAKAHSLESTEIVFTDGERYVDRWAPYGSVMRYPDNSATSYAIGRRRPVTDSYSFELLNDSTFYFRLNSFSLTETDIREIEQNIVRAYSYPDMVIDLRNNEGGDKTVMERLLSFFISELPEGIKPYDMVNTNGTFKSACYSQNISETDSLFADYTYDKARNGYIKENSISIEPRDSTYGGRIYILTGEATYSAAALFSSILVRSDRAVTVGRETPAGYHHMTAEKFMELRLPNSFIVVRIPLVKCVFDEEITPRTPEGRGLIPDYEVPITYEEVYYEKNDIILEKALGLIREGSFLNHPAFNQEAPSGERSKLPLYVLAFIGIAAAFAVSRRYRPRT